MNRVFPCLRKYKIRKSPVPLSKAASPSGLIGMVMAHADRKKEGMGRKDRKMVPFFPFKIGKFSIL